LFERVRPIAGGTANEDLIESEWQPFELLSDNDRVALWRASGPGGRSALLRDYPRFDSERTSARFIAEASRRTKLPEDPRFVGVVDADRAGLPHVILDDPVAELLATRIEREPLSPKLALRVFEDVAGGLAELTAAGIGPVDLSPGDVLVAGDRGLLLADVGLLGAAYGGRCHDLDHAAPERLAVGQRGVTGRLGRLVANATPGRAVHPTPASMTFSFASVLRAALAGPAKAGRVETSLTPEVRAVLERALAPEPGKRFRAPAEVVEALRADDGGTARPVARTAPQVARATRRRPPVRALVALTVGVAAGAGAAAGILSRPADPPAGTTLAGGGLRVELPADWTRLPAGQAPFDAGPAALVAQPETDPATRLTITRSGDSLLESLSDEQPQAVDLDGRSAWRWRDAPAGDRTADVYALETTDGPIVAACHAAPDAGADSLTACGAIVATLRVGDGRLLPAGAAPEARSRLAAALDALGRQRAGARRALASAPRPKGQAAAADRLAAAYGQADAAVDSAGTVGPPGAAARLRASLAAAGDSYASLAAAASAQDAARYRAARARVAERERAVRDAIAAVSLSAPAP
jgi:hypothetical protein